MQTRGEQLNKVFSALADPTRRQILLQVRSRDKSVNDIASEFQMSLPAISRHLKVLQRAGLISRKKEGQKRLCHAEPSIIQDAAAWLDFYQEFWSTRLENLKDFIEKDNEDKGKLT